MSKQFLTKKHAAEKKKKDVAKTVHKGLGEFYSEKQRDEEKRETFEEEVFKHLKNHTKKVLKK